MNITSGVKIKAVKEVIYGPEGIGKSSLAAAHPNALFIDTEGSTDTMDVKRLDKPTSWSMLMNEIAFIKANPTVCQTLVIDTVDWAERLCIESVCASHNKKGIEDFGYGNGYTYVAEEFGRMLDKLTELIDLGINVCLTAHSQIRKFEQPDEMGAYDRYELKLGKKTTGQTAPLVKEWADIILFCNYKTVVMSQEGSNKKKAQGGQRVMYTQHHPAWDAKNRFGLPMELPMEIKSIAHIFPQSQPQQRQVQPVPQAPIQQPVVNQPVPEQTPTQVEQVELLPESLPIALRDLMRQSGVQEKEIRQVVGLKGYFPEDMPVKDYPIDFIEGVLIGAWPQIFKAIQDDRNLPF